MKKIVAFIVMCFTCFSLAACGGTNYPGNTKSKYWLSEDNTMMFYFPAEAGRGNAAGHYLTVEETIEDIILDWNAKTGVVDVMTAGYEKVFTANTVTDSENLICTFEITSQKDGYNFPAEIIFHWEQTVNFGCINNIHSWSDELWYIPGGSDAYYHCVVCSEKQLATKSIKGINDATKIEATKYDVGEEIGSVTVTEKASIKHIVDNLNSLKLKELKYNEPTAIEYELTFYNAEGEIIKTIAITLDGWIDYGSLHSVVSGELDMVYIAGLFTAPDEEPGQNDILYVAAYPEDFEYNGRNYRLVQGEGLKTTATQEELGELLGYIIQEDDVYAFTQEYPSVDYVIENGIYDYYTNNRVALYSLKSYHNLSIICMRQLGDYVLFQSEGEQDLQFEIRDRAKEENLPCDDALEKFYEDESNENYFSAIKSHYVIVTYNEGTLEDIVTALYAGRVTIADLSKFGIEYYINPKQ